MLPESTSLYNIYIYASAYDGVRHRTRFGSLKKKEEFFTLGGESGGRGDDDLEERYPEKLLVMPEPQRSVL